MATNDATWDISASTANLSVSAIVSEPPRSGGSSRPTTSTGAPQRSAVTYTKILRSQAAAILKTPVRTLVANAFAER